MWAEEYVQGQGRGSHTVSNTDTNRHPDSKNNRMLIGFGNGTSGFKNGTNGTNQISKSTTELVKNYTNFFSLYKKQVQDMEDMTFLQHYEKTCEQRQHKRRNTKLPLCPCIPQGLGMYILKQEFTEN